jgi:hypothetical protein
MECVPLWWKQYTVSLYSTDVPFIWPKLMATFTSFYFHCRVTFHVGVTATSLLRPVCICSKHSKPPLASPALPVLLNSGHT